MENCLKQMIHILLTVLSVWQITKMVGETYNDGMSLALFYFLKGATLFS